MNPSSFATSSKWQSAAWQVLFFIWAIGVNIAYYWQFRDLIASYLERIGQRAGLPW